MPHQIGIDQNIAGIGDAERVAVGRGFGDRVHGDIAASAGAVVDHYRLAGLDRDMGAQDARGRSVMPPAEVETMSLIGFDG